MKRTLLILIAVLLVGYSTRADDIVATIRSILQWEDYNHRDSIKGYKVRFNGSAAVFVDSQQLVTNQVNLTNIFKAFENGQFKVTVTCLSHSEVESQESDPLFYFWYGRVLPVTNLVHTFRKITDN